MDLSPTFAQILVQYHFCKIRAPPLSVVRVCLRTNYFSLLLASGRWELDEALFASGCPELGRRLGELCFLLTHFPMLGVASSF